MKYIAFLRGINVGGINIKMVDLTDCFEKLGFQNIKTVLQTGNVIFESDKNITALKSEIEAGLTIRFGYAAIVFVYPYEEVEKIVEHYPYAESQEKHSYVVFMDEMTDEFVSTSPHVDSNVEIVQRGQNCIYWSVLKGSTLKSAFALHLSKASFRSHNTVRNLNTLRRLFNETGP